MTNRREYPSASIPGSSRLGVVTVGVVTIVGALGLLAALISSLFVPGLEATMVAAATITGIGALAFLGLWAQRRAYLRAVRNGEVQIPERWTPDIPHTW
jgi:hypothetical protein